MTITSTSIGTNSIDININGELNSGGIITAVDAALVAQGWAQFDLITPTGAAFAYQRIYRSTNIDGSTYKYMQLFFYPSETKIFIDFFESWNATTHVGTNQCFWGPMDVGAFVQYSYALCDIIILVSPRWVVFQTFINNEPGPWVGAFECERDAPEDTLLAGFPAWFATTSYMLGSGASCYGLESGVAGQASYSVAFPRNNYGTGYLASMYSGVTTPYYGSGSVSTANPATWASNLASSTASFGNYAWNTANKIVCAFRPRVQAEIHGRAIGPKITGGAYSIYNKINMNVDASYMWVSTGGTSTDHWVLPLHNFTYRGPTQTVNIPHASLTMITNSTTMYRKIYLAQNGYYYALAITGALHKINVTTLVLSVVASTGNLTDICYDGQYIWGAVYAANGTLMQIDTNNSDTVTIGAAVGASMSPVSIACDDTNIWIGCYFAGQAKVVQIVKATPSAVAFTTSLTGATSTPYPISIIVDNDGNAMVGTSNIFSSASQNFGITYTNFFQVKPGGTQVAFGLTGQADCQGVLMIAPRKCLLVDQSNTNNSSTSLSAYTVSTDTSTLSINIIQTLVAVSSLNNTLQWCANTISNTNMKISMIGGIPNCMFASTQGLTNLGTFYVNTPIHGNVPITAIATYIDLVSSEITTPVWGEFKYNMYYGTNNVNLYVSTSVWRADDGYATTVGAVGAGRLLLPV